MLYNVKNKLVLRKGKEIFVEVESKDAYPHFTAPPVVALISVSGKNVLLHAMSAETFAIVCKDVKLR